MFSNSKNETITKLAIEKKNLRQYQLKIFNLIKTNKNELLQYKIYIVFKIINFLKTDVYNFILVLGFSGLISLIKINTDKIS